MKMCCSSPFLQSEPAKKKILGTVTCERHPWYSFIVENLAKDIARSQISDINFERGAALFVDLFSHFIIIFDTLAHKKNLEKSKQLRYSYVPQSTVPAGTGTGTIPAYSNKQIGGRRPVKPR